MATPVPVSAAATNAAVVAAAAFAPANEKEQQQQVRQPSHVLTNDEYVRMMTRLKNAGRQIAGCLGRPLIGAPSGMQLINYVIELTPRSAALWASMKTIATVVLTRELPMGSVYLPSQPTIRASVLPEVVQIVAEATGDARDTDATKCLLTDSAFTGSDFVRVAVFVKTALVPALVHLYNTNKPAHVIVGIEYNAPVALHGLGTEASSVRVHLLGCDPNAPAAEDTPTTKVLLDIFKGSANDALDSAADLLMRVKDRHTKRADDYAQAKLARDKVVEESVRVHVRRQFAPKEKDAKEPLKEEDVVQEMLAMSAQSDYSSALMHRLRCAHDDIVRFSASAMRSLLVTRAVKTFWFAQLVYHYLGTRQQACCQRLRDKTTTDSKSKVLQSLAPWDTADLKRPVSEWCSVVALPVFDDTLFAAHPSVAGGWSAMDLAIRTDMNHRVQDATGSMLSLPEFQKSLLHSAVIGDSLQSQVIPCLDTVTAKAETVMNETVFPMASTLYMPIGHRGGDHRQRVLSTFLFLAQPTVRSTMPSHRTDEQKKKPKSLEDEEYDDAADDMTPWGARSYASITRNQETLLQIQIHRTVGGYSPLLPTIDSGMFDLEEPMQGLTPTLATEGLLCSIKWSSASFAMERKRQILRQRAAAAAPVPAGTEAAAKTDVATTITMQAYQELVQRQPDVDAIRFGLDALTRASASAFAVVPSL